MMTGGWCALDRPVALFVGLVIVNEVYVHWLQPVICENQEFRDE
jgi:hypothetical protein